MNATFEYPNFTMTYELRQSCAIPMYGQDGGTAIMGTEAMVVVTRSGCWLVPNKNSNVAPVEFLAGGSGGGGRAAAAGQAPAGRPAQPPTPQPPRQASDHWKNFFSCIKSRQKPTSDIENLVRSSAVCILGNVAMRAKTRLDFDEKTFTVKQPEARPFTKINYRAPWKLQV
jgi:hypothetical protein